MNSIAQEEMQMQRPLRPRTFVYLEREEIDHCIGLELGSTQTLTLVEK